MIKSTMAHEHLNTLDCLRVGILSLLLYCNQYRENVFKKYGLVKFRKSNATRQQQNTMTSDASTNNNTPQPLTRAPTLISLRAKSFRLHPNSASKQHLIHDRNAVLDTRRVIQMFQLDTEAKQLKERIRSAKGHEAELNRLIATPALDPDDEWITYKPSEVNKNESTVKFIFEQRSRSRSHSDASTYRSLIQLPTSSRKCTS
jgi:hypothetical protein